MIIATIIRLISQLLSRRNQGADDQGAASRGQRAPTPSPEINPLNRPSGR